jgi:hypothetical protein
MSATIKNPFPFDSKQSQEQMWRSFVSLSAISLASRRNPKQASLLMVALCYSTDKICLSARIEEHRRGDNAKRRATGV